MKKNWIISLILSFIAAGFSACSNNTDTEWRDANLAFIDNIKKVEGVHEIGDTINGYTGIYYQVLKEGTGVKPIIGNKVNVAYEGWMYNTTTSFDKNDNYDFTVGNTSILNGWNIAIQYMPVGAKWRIYIPYNQGYGTSAKSNIPAYSTLVFDLYLRKINSVN
jgi:peptidylprolyl isomerase